MVTGEPLRVLLVSPHEDQRAAVGDALQGAGDHRLFWVSQPDLALTRAQGLAPHVVLVDDDLGGSEAPEVLVRRLAAGLPGSAVLLLAEPNQIGVAQAAVLAGARAFIEKPVKADELLLVLRQVLIRRAAAPVDVAHEAQLGRVVVFCASKGGTGRTTLAINTAVSIREVTREPVVIVDADYAAPAIDVALNLKDQRDIRDLLPKLNQLDPDLILSVLATHSSGARVLLAPPPDALAYPPTLPQVQQVVAWLKRMFPWVLVDLGLPFDEAAFAFLDAADRVVVSVLPDMVGMRNTKLMLAQFDTRNYPAGKVWPLLNREGLLGGVKKADVITYLGRDLMFAIPNDQELTTEAVNRGVPMVVAHRRRPVAKAYRKLAVLLSEDRKLAAGAEQAPRTAAALAVTAAAAGAGATTAAAILPTAPPANPATQEAGPTPAVAATAETATAAQPSNAPAGQAGGKRRPLLIAGMVVLVLLLVALAGVVATRLTGSGNQAPAAPPPGEVQVAAAVGDPTASEEPGEQATHDAAATRVGQTLTRLLGPAPGATRGGETAAGEAAPSEEPGAVEPATATSTPVPSAMPTAPATSTPTSTPAPTDTPTHTPTTAPTATASPSPTETATTRPTSTARPTATPRPAARATPTRLATATRAAAPTQVPASVSAPALAAPAAGQSVDGVVNFRWVPTGALPPDAKYEVVWWNNNEAPDAARGLAAPVSDTSLSADLGVLYQSGRFTSSEIFWTVLIVRENPYVRLTTPSGSERRSFYYSTGGAAPPPPPPPK